MWVSLDFSSWDLLSLLNLYVHFSLDLGSFSHYFLKQTLPFPLSSYGTPMMNALANLIMSRKSLRFSTLLVFFLLLLWLYNLKKPILNLLIWIWSTDLIHWFILSSDDSSLLLNPSSEIFQLLYFVSSRISFDSFL